MKARLRRSRIDGFTLIELLVVIVIIALLMAIAIPAYLSQQEKAKDSEAKQYLTTAWKSARAAAVDVGGERYPSPASVLAEINASEPNLNVTLGSCSSLAADDPTEIVIDPDSTTTNLIMCSRSRSGSIWEATATPTSSLAMALAEPTVLYFTTNRDGNNEIYRVYDDGSSPVNLSNNPASDTEVDVNLDGSMLVYVSTRNGNKEIYTAAGDGTSPTRLTFDGSVDDSPSIANVPTKIIYSSDTTGNVEVWSMNLDTSGQVRIVINAATDDEPAINPAGTQVAFVRAGDIYTVNANGTGVTQRTSTGATDTSPRYSPDGTRIAFIRDGDIYTMNVDGTGLLQLTATANNGNPTYSPDGSKIAFNTSRDGNQEIYVMDTADGGNLDRITSDGGSDTAPIWRDPTG